MKTKKIIFLFLLPFLMTACVSSKKYKALDDVKNKVGEELIVTKKELKSTKTEQDGLATELATAKAKIATLEEAQATLKSQLSNLNGNFDEVNKKYGELLAQNEAQIKNASSDAKRLNEALTAKEKELEAKEKLLKDLESSLNTSKTNLSAAQGKLNDATKVLEEREKRLKELESVLQQQEAQTAALRKTISDALLGFKESDLTVVEKNGKVYVSLSQDLLFASGSTTIDKKGLEALKKLAEALKNNSDIDITVEGHTDNVPFGNRNGMKDNWDLSVMRSTSLVRELTKNGVDPKRVTASGRGEFFPVADNNSSTGKAQNRRSEIILSPKLDALYNLINNKQ